jgi:hypothetical protein
MDQYLDIQLSVNEASKKPENAIRTVPMVMLKLLIEIVIYPILGRGK